MNEGCGRFRRKLASKSPLVVTSARFWYQDLRGLILSFSVPLPCSSSQVHLTSLAVNGLPSCHLTPWRNLKVSTVPSSFHDHSLARSGTIVSSRFCGDVLVEHHEVVEHRHHRAFRDDRRFLEDRHARRAVAMGYLEDAAGFLRNDRARTQRERQRCEHRRQTPRDSSTGRPHCWFPRASRLDNPW